MIHDHLDYMYNEVAESNMLSRPCTQKLHNAKTNVWPRKFRVGDYAIIQPHGKMRTQFTIEIVWTDARERSKVQFSIYCWKPYLCTPTQWTRSTNDSIPIQNTRRTSIQGIDASSSLLRRSPSSGRYKYGCEQMRKGIWGTHRMVRFWRRQWEKVVTTFCREKIRSEKFMP